MITFDLLNHPAAPPATAIFADKTNPNLRCAVIVVSGHNIQKPTFAKSCELPTVWVDCDFMMRTGRR